MRAQRRQTQTGSGVVAVRGWGGGCGQWRRATGWAQRGEAVVPPSAASAGGAGAACGALARSRPALPRLVPRLSGRGKGRALASMPPPARRTDLTTWGSAVSCPWAAWLCLRQMSALEGPAGAAALSAPCPSMGRALSPWRPAHCPCAGSDAVLDPQPCGLAVQRASLRSGSLRGGQAMWGLPLEGTENPGDRWTSPRFCFL